MSLNRTIFSVTVAETDHDRNFWASRAGLQPGTVAAIRGAEIVLVPWIDRGKPNTESFPTGTSDFFKALKADVGSHSLAIAVEPSDYMELALHADELRWPTLLLRDVLLPIVIGLLTDQIDKLIAAPTPPATVELKIVIENERGKCITVDYKGPPGRLIDTVVAETKQCLPKPQPALEKAGE